MDPKNEEEEKMISVDHYRLDYIFTFIPIAYIHLIIPPLSVIQKTELPIFVFQEFYDKLPQELRNYNWVKSNLMYLIEDDYKKVKWSKVFFSCFVHANYHHLFSNLAGAFFLGDAVYSNFGSFGLYFIFVAGGLAAEIPSSLFEVQRNTIINFWGDLLHLNESNSYLPSFMRSTTNDITKGFGKMVGKVITAIPKYCCGSSGCVFALLGAQMTLKSFSIMNSLRIFIKKIRKERMLMATNTDTFIVRLNDYFFSTIKVVQEYLFKSPLSLIFIAIDSYWLISNCNIISNELNSIYGTKLMPSFLRSDLTTRFSTAINAGNIGHVAHVQGFVFGVGVTCVLCLVSPCFNRTLKKMHSRKKDILLPFEE